MLFNIVDIRIYVLFFFRKYTIKCQKVTEFPPLNLNDGLWVQKNFLKIPKNKNEYV
jgi:hypothetical protein